MEEMDGEVREKELKIGHCQEQDKLGAITRVELVWLMYENDIPFARAERKWANMTNPKPQDVIQCHLLGCKNGDDCKAWRYAVERRGNVGSEKPHTFER